MPESAARIRLREAREQAAAEREAAGASEPDLDVDKLARHLSSAIAGLDRYIATEAKKRSDKLGIQYAKAADDRVKAATEQTRIEMQRLQDLVAEFRRQREPLERAADRAQRVVGAIHKAKYAGEETISVQALMDILNAPATVPEGATISEG